jgi:hypothetical protein
MIKFYKELDPDDAVAGMVLSEAIVDRQSGTLLPAATVLTDQLHASLRRRALIRYASSTTSCRKRTCKRNGNMYNGAWQAYSEKAAPAAPCCGTLPNIG